VSRAALPPRYAAGVRIAGIGYQGRTIDEVIERLRSASIATLIDVRELPWSRRPEFAKKKLAERLAHEGLRYVHLRSAGNPRENRKSGAASAEILARYREHLARTPGVLEEILAEAQGHSVALLCYEADMRECHRSVLLEALAGLRLALAVDAL
jgi:uncharacterized protein (DUF488 family)